MENKITKSQVQASFEYENGELKIKDSGSIEIVKEQMNGRIFIALYIEKSFIQRTELFSDQTIMDVQFAKSMIEKAS